MNGVGTSTAWPSSRTALDQGVQLDGPAGLGVLQHRRAHRAHRAGDLEPLVDVLLDRGADPGADLAAPPASSRAGSRRTSSSATIWSIVVPVSTEIGFIVMLPQSLNQTSLWIRSEAVMSKPAAREQAGDVVAARSAPRAGRLAEDQRVLRCRAR